MDKNEKTIFQIDEKEKVITFFSITVSEAVRKLNKLIESGLVEDLNDYELICVPQMSLGNLTLSDEPDLDFVQVLGNLDAEA